LPAWFFALAKSVHWKMRAKIGPQPDIASRQLYTIPLHAGKARFIFTRPSQSGRNETQNRLEHAPTRERGWPPRGQEPRRYGAWPLGGRRAPCGFFTATRPTSMYWPPCV